LRLRTGNPLCGLREQFAFFCRRAIRSRRQPPSTPFAVAQEDITAAYPPAKPQKIVENFFTGVLETFRALGVEFVSLSEQVDTSTPTGKMVFTVLGAVAELERSLIAERVKAGLRNARAKGTRRGRHEGGNPARTGRFLARDLRSIEPQAKGRPSARCGRSPKTLHCPKSPRSSLAESLAIRLPKTRLCAVSESGIFGRS